MQISNPNTQSSWNFNLQLLANIDISWKKTKTYYWYNCEFLLYYYYFLRAKYNCTAGQVLFAT